MAPNSKRRLAGALFAAALVAGCAGQPTTVAELDAEGRAALGRMLAEEDRRPAPADAVELRAGLASDNALLRRYAVRGMGRLENPAALDTLAPLLRDPDAEVRAQAAMAVAQSVFNEASPVAAEMLREQLAADDDAAARGSLARALGRLRPVDTEAATATLARLIDVTRDAPIETLLPAMRGIEWLVRTNTSAGRGEAAPTTLLNDAGGARLVELTRYGRAGGEGFVEPAAGAAPDTDTALAAARVRRLAMAALRAGAALDAATVETALYDPDVEVRRIAAAAAAAVPDGPSMPVLVQIALADGAAPVRYEGLRVYGMRLRLQMGCAPIVAALQDDDTHVVLQAIDLLAQSCRGVPTRSVTDPRAETLLLELARATPQLPGGDAAAAADIEGSASARAGTAVAWHRGAHALVSLARLDAGVAAPLLPAFAGHPQWQVRMYAARAAGITGTTAILEDLVDDQHPNVVEAALRGLAGQRGDGASGAAVAALESNDYQLLITAADTLESTADEAALAALLDALARITAQQRETSRDPRTALLERIGELGDAADADAVRPYLNDFDPQVAALAATVLTEWTGETVSPAPRPLSPQPFPSIDELLELDGATARIFMQGGGVVEMTLHPFEAPTNVARFVRQARDGYFEGLTFHRVVPNFVIQGGSPGANEYVGDGPFSRDEVAARSHLRGTVGISTRGRDTGDGQIFVNLVDNIRLDHNFTIIGTVTAGMDVVDAVLEGAVIERVVVQ